MKLTAELDVGAITVSEDEMLIITLPTNAIVSPEQWEDETVDPLMQEFVKVGLGDRVFIIYADGVQMAKVKK